MDRYIIERGAIQHIKKILNINKVENIFLVSEWNTYELSGAKEIFEPIFNNFNVKHFSKFELNPKIEDIQRGIELFRTNHIDVVIAIGGGSSIDMAKAINFIQAQEFNNIEDIVINKIENAKKGFPLIAIPTTFGTGSEATHFAVVYLNKIKYSLSHSYILPDYASIDPNFSEGIPRNLKIISGLDALSQGIEAYWSVNSTQDSDKYAIEAIKLVWENLKNSIINNDFKSNELIAYGSNLAGRAINIAKTTAPHSLSYILTTHFNIPHGAAVSYFLPFFCEYNFEIIEDDCNDKRGVEYIKNKLRNIFKIFEVSDHKELKTILIQLYDEFGIDISLRKLNKSKDELFELFSKEINLERLKNNPRVLNEVTIKNIISDLWI